ncbi:MULTISPECIES: STAS domain-containing protein [Vibrio]|uniref:STAS domain-containing protein n=1 Tax=Vibrio TaxID=662 RepID=UPI001BD29C4D|nr:MULTISPECIES: STAS domain-containing protein [Vibrio]MBS9910217.1 STAS domain-containing protein [Vibrio alginolyticus]MBT0048053.1 STAS domain-containing protein [Vibrio alginolyticus]MBT0061833.1 STAS domain-containing protein [Vibrio alginolyticus]MCG6355691.1 STAS domain-containing protein [Vibrio alginolyticus]MDK9792673.1 STAS domain-containing protein [Vibrio sp. D431a]
MELRRLEINQDKLAIEFFGDLDASGCRQAQHHIDEVIHNNHHKEVEINLQHVQFLDSSGIGAIVYLYKRLVERERSMSIENVSGQPLEIMSLLRINHAIPVNSKGH